jgi:hypothetical protein
VARRVDTSTLANLSTRHQITYALRQVATRADAASSNVVNTVRQVRRFSSSHQRFGQVNHVSEITGVFTPGRFGNGLTREHTRQKILTDLRTSAEHKTSSK